MPSSEPNHNRPEQASYSQVVVGRQAPLQEWSDEALMADYQRGDATAFEMLFRRYKDRVYGYFVRRFNDREAAEDLFQSTFLRVHRARRDYDTNRPFATWIFAIASNLGRDELKRREDPGGAICM